MRSSLSTRVNGDPPRRERRELKQHRRIGSGAGSASGRWVGDCCCPRQGLLGPEFDDFVDCSLELPCLDPKLGCGQTLVWPLNLMVMLPVGTGVSQYW